MAKRRIKKRRRRPKRLGSKRYIFNGTLFRLKIDKDQVRPIHEIDYPQNGHEYIYLNSVIENKLLPPVMAATNVELQQTINKLENSAPTYVVPPLELLSIKNKALLPTKAEIMIYIEQYENARNQIQKSRKCISIPKIKLPNVSGIWFNFLFGIKWSSTSSVNPVHNIDESVYLSQKQCALVISNFIEWITSKIIRTSDVTEWTYAIYATMDDPCDNLLSNMRILTQMFINARAEIEDPLDQSALRYSCLINIVSEKFKQHDLGDITNYKSLYFK